VTGNLGHYLAGPPDARLGLAAAIIFSSAILPGTSVEVYRHLRAAG